MNRLIFSLLIFRCFNLLASVHTLTIGWEEAFNHLDRDLVEEAREAYIELFEMAEIKDLEHFAIIDLGKHSSEERFFIFNDVTGTTFSYKTTHGRGSDTNHDGFAELFGNRSQSFKSSLGAYITSFEYFSQTLKSHAIKLHGLSDTNSNAWNRGIVIHGAWYASPEYLKQHGKLGRSLGCPAISHSEYNQVSDLLTPGKFIYIGNSN